jgi:GH35 family endo-1,4-beta-xylanase
VTLVVRRPDGRSLANAEVTLVQKRHKFLFGCNLFRWGRISDTRREERYRKRFAALLNYATLPFYWAAYEPERGKPGYDYTDRVAAWCRQMGITCKGHPLAWDPPASSPRWLPEDPDEIRRLSTGRVREIVRRFAGRIDRWDVVNEPTDLTRFPTRMNTWARQLGAVPLTALHLKVARAANPNATLLVNDYRTDEAYLQILRELREESDAGTPQWEGAARSDRTASASGSSAARLPFDIVGIQSHMHRGVWASGRIWEVCERFATLSLPLHFTETTLVSGPQQGSGWGKTTPEGEERQADAATRFYTVLFSHPAVDAITWWDFSDDGAWQNAPAGWLRKDMSPKPVYERLEALIKKDWWTRRRGITDAGGEWQSRAFYGDYEVTVRTPDRRSVSHALAVRKGAGNRFEIALP